MPTQSQIQALERMPISGTSMVLRDQDPFFGSLGALAAQATGLVATGRDGLVTPIFRSNIFVGRDPSMSGLDYRMADIYSRRMADMAAMQQYSMSRRLNSLFDEQSAFGRFFLEKDANGEYVQSSGTVNAYNMLRGLATGPQGSSILTGLLTNTLGYDRGAGMETFAKNANAIVSTMRMFLNSAFTPNADGTATYKMPDVTDAGFQAGRTAAANIMNGSLQRVMYGGKDGGGLLKDWGTTHGISETLASQILTDAAMNGRLNEKSSLTAEDRVHKERIDAISDGIKSNNEYIEFYERLRENATGPNKDVFTEKIEEYKAANEGLEAEKKSHQDQMESYDWDGDFAAFTSEVLQFDNKRRDKESERAALLDELNRAQQEYTEAETSGDTENSKLLHDKYEEIRRQLEKKDAELDEIIQEQEEVSKKVDEVNKHILKDISGAVDTAKNLFGSDQAAYDELYRMTGGSISRDKGMAKSMNMAIQEFMDIGASRGLSNGFMAQMLTDMNGQVRAGYGSSGLFADTGVSALLSTRYAKQAALAMGGEGMDDRHRQQLEASVAWRAGNAGASDMRRVLVQLETARQEGAISEQQYNDLAKDLTSGDGRTRGLAQQRLYSVMFNGNVDEGFRQMNNGAVMTRMESLLGDRASKAVDNLFAATEANETQEADLLTQFRRELAGERNLLRLSGLHQKTISELEATSGLAGAKDVLQHLANTSGEGAQNAALVLSQISEIEGDNTPNSVEAARKAMKFINGPGRMILGTQYSQVTAAAMNSSRSAMSEYNNKELDTELSGPFKTYMMGLEGAVTKDGKLTHENLALTGNAVFGSNSLLAQSSKSWSAARRGQYEAAQKAYREAQENGNHEDAQTVLQNFYNYNEAGSLTKELFARSVERDVIFRTEDAKKKKDENGFEFEKNMKDAEWLRSKGVRVTDETLMFARNYRALQAKGELSEDGKKKLADFREQQAVEAYRNSTPGMEAIVKALTGTGDGVDIIKNGNVDHAAFIESIQTFASNLGFTGDRSDGSQIMSLFTGSALGSSNGLGKGLARIGGHNATDFAKMFSENLNAKKFTKLSDKFQNASTPEKRKKLQIERFELMEKAAEKDLAALQKKYGKNTTDEQKAEIENMQNRVKAIKKNKDDLKTGVVQVDDFMNGGVSSDKINELLDKIGVLVDTLKSKGMDSSYGR